MEEQFKRDHTNDRSSLGRNGQVTAESAAADIADYTQKSGAHARPPRPPLRPASLSRVVTAGRLGGRTCLASGATRLDPTQRGGEALMLQRKLRAKLAGQDEAIDEIVNIYQMYLAGLTTRNRPVGSLLFLGPTGTGKTRTVEALAESLVGVAGAVIKVDCGEFQHSHEIAKLVGSPPGYLGHRETHPLLSQEALSQFHTARVKLSFVLFDEIEKASDALWNLLLGILDKATLTLGDNRRVDFSNSLIFLTSNLGAREISSIFHPALGYGALPGAAQTSSPEELVQRMRRTAIEAARRKFTPEFINRLGKLVVFRPLTEPDLQRIVHIELGRLQDHIFTSSAAGSFLLKPTDAARRRLLLEGTDARYGARHLKRAIEQLIVQPLSNLLASGQIRMGDHVEIDDEGEGPLHFSLVGNGLSVQEMSEAAGPSARPLMQLAVALGESPGTNGINPG